MCILSFKSWEINTLSSKIIQTEKAKSSHFDRTRGYKNQKFPTLGSPKFLTWFTPREILAKRQLGHSYTFRTMAIMKFSTVSNSSHHPLGCECPLKGQTNLDKCRQLWTSLDQFEKVWSSLDKFRHPRPIWTNLSRSIKQLSYSREH